MAVYDLTHPMDNKMPVYPGKCQPFIGPSANLENDGYRELRIEMDGHTGTHIDAPAHMLSDGKTLDQYPVSHFTGTAAVIHIPEGTRLIGTLVLKPFEDKIADSDYVLLVTGWSRFWGEEAYFRNFPVLTEDAAVWLVSHHLKGIGIDAISVDSVDSEEWPVHHVLFNAGCVIVENLTFPPDFELETAVFHCFPLNIANADGSPVRAVVVK